MEHGLEVVWVSQCISILSMRVDIFVMGQCIWLGTQPPCTVAVKNRFSDLTKEQEGRDWPRTDIMNRHQVKALREGCCERKEAQMGVSSREKINTNRNLVRATTKSKSETQTVSNGCVGRGGRDGGF